MQTLMPYTELDALQNLIRDRIGTVDQWVRVEIESLSESRGHHYLGLIQKEGGKVVARARATIWASQAGIIEDFEQTSGQSLKAGLSIVVHAVVDYHPVYGLNLNICGIDSNYSLGQRELEKRATIERLGADGMMEMQQELGLPFLPSRIAVISSSSAAGYGDFVNQLNNNEWGYSFDCTLFQSLMQGENAPASIIGSLEKIVEEGTFDLILIFRGGGAEADLYCFDDYALARAIAECPFPVITAIGHERDYHVADMVAHDHFKTPTALAVFLIDWVSSVEREMEDALASVMEAMNERLRSADSELERCITNIRFALNATISALENRVALSEAGIRAADPRSILNQGYVLAVGKDGTILKNAGSCEVGDEFSLRFSDGVWNCLIKDKK